MRGFRTIPFDMVPKVGITDILASLSFKTILFDMVPKDSVANMLLEDWF